MFTRICQHCGKTFECETLVRNRGQYCSRICTIEGINGPRRTPMVTQSCLNCGKSFTYNPSHQPTKYKGQPRKYCSIKCSRVHGAARGPRNAQWKPQAELTCEICGTIYHVKQSKVGRSRFCSPRCRQAHVILTMPRISSIERKMAAALAAIGVVAAAQHPIAWYVVDFAIPEEQIVIECDGNYWHSKPGQQAKDARKDTYLTHRGWRVIRLTETAINASPEACAKRVAAMLNHGSLPH